MSSIEWAFPGPAPYTYMHINPRDLGIESTDPYELGVQYVVQLNLWMQGIEAGKKIDVSRDVPVGQMTPQECADELTRESQEMALHERNLKAQPMEFKRGGRTPEEAEKLVQEALGATVMSSDAPWNNEDLTPTAPKPWEKKESSNETGDLFA